MKQPTSITLTAGEKRRITAIARQIAWILKGADGLPPVRHLCTRCGVNDRGLTIAGDVAHNSLCYSCYAVYMVAR